MNGLLILQILALQIFILCVLCGLSQAIVKRIFPSTVRRVLYGWGACGLLGLVLAWTVPGRARHLEFFKHMLMDEVVAKDFNGGGSGLRNWLGTKFGDFAADIVTQQIRVEKIGVVSIGLIEDDWGWAPVSVGFVGIVCPNFFFSTPKYEIPDVFVTPSKDAEGNWQVELYNASDAEYTCEVLSCLNSDKSPLCKFDINGETGIRIQQQKKGFVNKVKRLLDKDKTVVPIPEPIAQGLCITFKRGKRVLKSSRLTVFGDELRAGWYDPK